MTGLARFDGPANRMQPVDDARFGHLVLPFEIRLLKGFLVLDRSAVNGSPLFLGEGFLGEGFLGEGFLGEGFLVEGPLDEERLGGGRLAAFTGLSTLCFEPLLASAFFVTPCSTTREFCGDCFPCFAPDRFAGRCAACDCFARDFCGAALDPSVFSSRVSGPCWVTSVPPCLKDRFV